MTDDPHNAERNGFVALRQIARQAPTRAEEHCDLCGEAIGPEHRHVLNIAAREVFCACRACAFLFDYPAAGAGMRRLIPTRCLYLTDFDMTNAQWKALEVPVNVAFFAYNTTAQRVMAFYPSPAGPTEAPVPAETWNDLAQSNPILQQMEPDVEALLIHQGGDERARFLVPIDECYKLVGLIRLHWRGLSGGAEVRKEIGRFFERLRERAADAGGVHA